MNLSTEFQKILPLAKVKSLWSLVPGLQDLKQRIMKRARTMIITRMTNMTPMLASTFDRFSSSASPVLNGSERGSMSQS